MYFIQSNAEHLSFKQGYMWKKGHKRKNWNERWFLLKPDLISYYVGEDLMEKKGEISLNSKCYVEVNVLNCISTKKSPIIFFKVLLQ